MQVGAVVDDGSAKRHDVIPGRTPRLGFFARRVHLDMDVELLCLRLGFDLLAAVLVEELRLLQVVDARDAPEVGDLGEVLAAACGMSSVSASRPIKPMEDVPDCKPPMKCH